MKVAVLGGPTDGVEMDIPAKSETYTFYLHPKVPPSIPSSSPFASLGEVTYIVRRIKSAAGRDYTVIVEPTLDRWLRKSFPTETDKS